MPGASAFTTSILLLAASSARAQCQLQKLLAGDGALGDHFGDAMAVDGDTLIVGAPGHGPLIPGAGAAYVFERVNGTWTLTATLTANDAQAQAAFGFSVALDGDTAVIGADFDDAAGADSGAAYVFERSGSTWTQSAKLVPLAVQAGDRFGEAVAVDGDALVAGKHAEGKGLMDPGGAWVYERVGGVWIEVAHLIDPALNGGEHFGVAVALSGDIALIAARDDDDFFGFAGAVYVYERRPTGWTATTKLYAPDAPLVQFFGSAVALEGNRALIGASDAPTEGIGAAYVFERVAGSWQSTAKLVPSDGTAPGMFGIAVALSGERACVGAARIAAEAGAAYLYELAGASWTQIAKLVSLDSAAHDYLGYSVALTDELALAGAPGDDDAGGKSGSFYCFAAAGASQTSLWASPAALSLASGGSQSLALRSCQDFAGGLYWMLGSASGTSPGLAVDGELLPLNAPDGYFSFTLQAPNGPVLSGTLGFLGPTGAITAAVNLPAGLDPALAGITLHHAGLVFDLSAGAVVSTSNPAALLLAP